MKMGKEKSLCESCSNRVDIKYHNQDKHKKVNEQDSDNDYGTEQFKSVEPEMTDNREVILDKAISESDYFFSIDHHYKEIALKAMQEYANQFKRQ